MRACVQTHPPGQGQEAQGRVQWKGSIAVARSWALAPCSPSQRALKLPTGGTGSKTAFPKMGIERGQ